MAAQLASPPPDEPTGSLDSFDWIALTVFGLTTACTLVLDIAAAIERSGADIALGSDPGSLMFFIGEVFLPIGAVIGLIAGIVILRRDRQPKWTGYLALASPVVALIGGVAALATVLSGAAF